MKNFKATSVQSKIIHPEPDDDLNVWAIPTVSEEVVDDGSTNAFGLKPSWRETKVEEVIEEPVPLTAEEIEEIRQAAYEEGFNQGKEEGFSAGFDEGKKSGHEEGLKAGHEEGVEQGISEGREEVEKLQAHWNTLIEQLNQPMAVVEKNIEEQLLHLVVQLTEAITHIEAKTNPEIILNALSEGIKALPSQEAQTQILLHPEDIKLIEKEFGEQYIQEQGWRLLAAPQLAPGSCQIENSTSNIDLSIKSRLTEVLDSFLQEALHQK